VKVLIVDDEALVRNELAYLLTRVAADCTVREADTAIQALAFLQQAAFDVVFLDVRMPGLSGIDAAAVIEKLPLKPAVVFVTAHEEHALRAFELAAFDYLLKPVTEERLSATVGRLRARNAAKSAPQQSAAGRLPVDWGGRTFLVPIGDVRFVQARGHTVTVVMFDQTFRFRGTLGECAQRLEPHGFIRVHRAYLVNPRHVVEANPIMAGAYALRVDDRARSEVPVSRNFAAAVRTALEL
jgi:two-component system, LytTR family, response regulator LytT